MSEETNTMLEHRYEDQFSYLSEEGSVMLRETSFFAERKIAEVGEEDDVEEKIEALKSAFGRLEQKVNDFVEADDQTPESARALKEELQNASAIGNFEELLNRLDKTAGNELAEHADPVENEDESSEEQDDENAVSEEGVGYYEKIADRAEELAKQSDWPYVSVELDNLSNKWAEGPEAEEEKVHILHERFQKAAEAFEQRKKEHYEKLERQRKENLERKKELLAALDEIVSSENWTAARKVGGIKKEFQNIGSLPSGKGEDLDENFEELLKQFQEHKVDRLVNKRQQEEDNLTGKLIVLDKLEELAASVSGETDDWKALDKEFDRLIHQFKKIGKVPPDKSDEVWNRYKSAQEEYYDRKYKFDEKHRKQFDKFYQKKEDLCNKAEALINADDLAKAARELNRLHRKWKKTGNLPQKDEDEMWARFKAATDAFNEYKSENIDELRRQEEENYKSKIELIERARELNSTTDWDKGHSKMQSLLDQWKKVGPVPRNKYGKLWKKFKKAQDQFYDRRREYFKEQKEEQKENLKEKESILDKLRELGSHEDPFEAVEQAKPLQEEFKKAGYVPIKKKNQIWKEYREACDIIYERFRAAKSGNRVDQELAKADLDPEDRSKLMDMRKEYKRVKQEMQKLKQEVLQYRESGTYFTSSSDDNPLLKEIQSKIEKAEEKLEKKQQRLDSLDREIEDLSKSE